MNCYYHPETSAVGTCSQCGKAACRSCIQDLSGALLCKSCIALRLKEVESQKDATIAEHANLISRAQRRIRISKLLFIGFALFGLIVGIVQAVAGGFAQPGQPAPSVLSVILALPLAALFIGYVAWAFYWGLPPLWFGFRGFFKNVGCFLFLTPIGWLILLFSFIFFAVLIGEFYCLFGGGVYQYFKTRRIAPATT